MQPEPALFEICEVFATCCLQVFRADIAVLSQLYVEFKLRTANSLKILCKS